MTEKRYVARSSEIAARKLGSEMMIMSGRDSTLYTLNEVATVIWEAADGSTSLDEIVRSRVCSQFEVQLDVALQDAETLVEQLASHGIQSISNEPIPRVIPARQEAR